MKKGLIQVLGSTVLAVLISGCTGKGVSHSVKVSVSAAQLPGVSSSLRSSVGGGKESFG